MKTDQISDQRMQTLHRYLLGILAALAALWLRKLLAPILGDQNPYHTAWAAVVFSAWYCGVGPTIATIFLDLIGIWYWFLPPVHSFALADPKPTISGMLGFVIFSGFIIALGEANRRSLAKSRLAKEQLRNAHAELEKHVQERTADLNAANQNLRELSSSLQQLRDEERKQIARELHDSVGQLLAALSMNVGALQSQALKLDAAAARNVSDSAGLIAQISNEVRTISHLLHPPLLDVAGLACALRWYVDGFSERSKINVDLEIPSEFRRLSSEMEIAIFRIVQECLTNIHRHSGSKTAKIVIHEEDRHLLVQIKDSGKGIPLAKQLELSSSGRTGVGFRGMRERVRQLGGELEIQSYANGTTVVATVPGGSLKPVVEGSEVA